MNEKGEQIKIFLMRGLAVVGFIALLVIGLWGTVQVVKRAPQIFSALAAVTTTITSVFVPGETLTINTPESLVPSDNVFKLSFEHKNKRTSTYILSYTCADGVSLEMPGQGGVYEEVACGTASPFSSEDGGIVFIPLSEKNRFVDVTLTIQSVNEDSSLGSQDQSVITIVNERLSGNSSTETSDISKKEALTAGEKVDRIYPVTDSRSVSNPQGQVDLAVRIIETGIIDQTDTFLPRDVIHQGEKAAVRFLVTNLGTKASDNWYFNAVLPSYPLHIFHSEAQRALMPGDRIEFTLGFDQLNNSLTKGVITVNVDPAQMIANEASRENNIEQIEFDIAK